MPKNQNSFCERALQTSLRRLLAFLLFLSIISSGLYFYATSEILKPSQWYFYTVQGAEIEGSSSAKNPVIEKQFITPEIPGCDWAKLTPPQGAPTGAQYRGVTLCNNAGISDDKFKTRYKYFQEKVDALYSDYRAEILGKILMSIACGLSAWLLIVASVFVVKWINTGKKS